MGGKDLYAHSDHFFRPLGLIFATETTIKNLKYQ